MSDVVNYYRVIQYFFSRQWNALKKYANDNGVEIIGDLPIYVAMDSVDVWSHPGLFELDEYLVPTEVAGCPPDGFSAVGQLWGNQFTVGMNIRKQDMNGGFDVSTI